MDYDPALLDPPPPHAKLLTARQVWELLYLSSNRLEWPRGVRVRDVQVEDGPDHNGDESLFVLLLVADDTPERVLVSPVIEAAIGMVQDAVLAAGDTRFVYVRVLRESEPAELEREVNEAAEADADEAGKKRSEAVAG